MEIDHDALKARALELRFNISLSGVLSRSKSKIDRRMGEEISRLFELGRAAFIAGNFDEVAQMFAVISE